MSAIASKKVFNFIFCVTARTFLLTNVIIQDVKFFTKLVVLVFMLLRSLGFGENRISGTYIITEQDFFVNKHVEFISLFECFVGS